MGIGGWRTVPAVKMYFDMKEESFLSILNSESCSSDDNFLKVSCWSGLRVLVLCVDH